MNFRLKSSRSMDRSGSIIEPSQEIRRIVVRSIALSAPFPP